MTEKKKRKDAFPTVAMRGTVAFPHMVIHFEVGRERSIHAVKAAQENDRRIFLLAQRDLETENPAQSDLFQIGVVAEIRQTLKTPDGVLRVLAEGLYPAAVKQVYEDEEDGMLVSTVRRLPLLREETVPVNEMEAMIRSLKTMFEKYSALVPRMPNDIAVSVTMQKDPLQVFEAIAFNTILDYTERQTLLECPYLFGKMDLLYAMLVEEVNILKLEKEIHDRTQEQIDKEQKEYYLREQLSVISQQLNEETGETDDIDSYLKRIYALDLPQDSEDKLVREAKRLRRLPMSSQESYVITNYLDTCLQLPWNTLTEDTLNLSDAEATLEEEHYGLKKVKERILESLAVRMLNPELKGQILCLVGPPGVGKSSIAKSIAKAVSRKFVRVSLGGVRDEADIRGHRKTYVGAMPGRMIEAITQAGSRNPLVLLDELDKMSNDYKGDPSAALLEVLDAEQNHEFRDHYLEIPFDLSQVMFIATANTLSTVPTPLLDRMEIIEITSYTREEKFQIARQHLVKKQLAFHGLREAQCHIEDDALYGVIDTYTKEAGVRNLERTIGTICRKTAKMIASGERKRVTIRCRELEKYLGIPKYLPDAQNKQDAVGVVNGLAWTSVGGTLMPLEALAMEGKGSIEITGYLGQVMSESARIAVSYTRSVAKKYGIPADFYQNTDIHIHAPEGAVPKDGPSAGVTMTTALISALSGIPVRADVAMTGEISLHGNVMPIGGLREKSMAAYKAGIRTVLIPAENLPDIEDVDEIVREHTTFVPCRTLEEVLKHALAEKPAAVKKKYSRTKKAEETRA